MVESAEIGKNGHFTWIVYVCMDCGHRIFGAVINGLEGGFGVNTKCVMYTIRFSFRSMANGGAWFLVFLWPEQIFCGVDVLRCIASFFLSQANYFLQLHTQLKYAKKKPIKSLNKCCWEYVLWFYTKDWRHTTQNINTCK